MVSITMVPATVIAVIVIMLSQCGSAKGEHARRGNYYCRCRRFSKSR